MRTWKDVATLVKTKNLRGRFVARPAANLPCVFEAGMHISFVPPQDDLPRVGVVDYVSILGNGNCEVGFDSVKEESSAYGLIGCHCLVKRSDIEGISTGAEFSGFAGWELAEGDGVVIGHVVGLVENPAHPLLEIDRANDRGTAFVPLVDEFICDIDEQSRTLTVDLPTGLLDL